MINWVFPIQQWWRRTDSATARLTLAVVLSLVFHLILLMLKLGEYGEGLPGFELPLNDRHARSPEMHLDIKNPVNNPATRNTPQPVVPLPAPQLPSPQLPSPQLPSLNPEPPPQSAPIVHVTELPKAEFDWVELPAPVVLTMPTVIAPTKPHKSKPKLITSVAESNPDFKVASAEQAELGMLIAEENKENAGATELMPEVKSEEMPLVVAPDLEKLAQERLEQEKIEHDRALAKLEQAQAVDATLKEQQKLAKLHEQEIKQAQQQAELERQRLAKLATQRAANELAEKAIQEELAKQHAKEAAQKLQQDQLAQIERQKTFEKEQKMLAARAVQQAEQLRLVEVARLEKEREAQLQKEKQQKEQQQKEQLRQQQLIQEQQKKEQQERELAEKNRLEQEQKVKLAQQAERQAEQLAAQVKAQHENELRQAAQKAEQAQADERARIQAQANAKQQSNGIDDLLGAASNSQGTGSSAAKPNMDKLLSGRTFDFDKSGDSLKSTYSANLPTPKVESASNARRSIFGSKNVDVGLSLYIQSWRQKIERNGRLNYSQSAKDHMHTDPIVTVSIRSDGSVENITILRSSGRPEMDEAIRRITLVNAPYSVFPPSLARKYDVIDIRQIWVFDDTLHIVDEMR